MTDNQTEVWAAIRELTALIREHETRLSAVEVDQIKRQAIEEATGPVYARVAAIESEIASWKARVLGVAVGAGLSGGGIVYTIATVLLPGAGN